MARPTEVIMTGADNKQLMVWDSGDAAFHGHVHSSSEGANIPLWNSANGLKVFTSCAAVVIVSLAAGQPTASSNTRIASNPLISSTEVIRSMRASPRDKSHTEDYVGNVGAEQECQSSCEAISEEVSEEATMLTTTELNRRELILKRTINGTALALAVGGSASLFGSVSLVELIPGLLAGIGVLGSCGIQLNKVEALRHR